MKEDNEYTKCPFCNQMARRTDLESGVHVCWGPMDNSHKTLGIWDEG
jgi:acetyl-CoA carboxylase beta subunit